jgi:hypothetical protein
VAGVDESARAVAATIAKVVIKMREAKMRRIGEILELSFAF